MTKLKYLIILTIICMFITGCGTVISQYIGHNQIGNKIEYKNKKQYKTETCGIGQPNVYSGSAFDLRALLSPFICKRGGEGGLRYIYYYPLVLPGVIIDLPLSLSADTIILPYTVYRQIKYGSIIELKEK